MILLKTAIILVVLFGLLVGLHELGHFLAAIFRGMWVQEFAWGFGPSLLSKKYKDTKYKINLIPLGGYVKIFGEQNLYFNSQINKEFKELPKDVQKRIKNIYIQKELDNINLDDELLRQLIDSEEGLSDENKIWLYKYAQNDKKRIKNPRRFSNKSFFSKVLVIVAGPIMNLLLGFIIYGFYLVLTNNEIMIPKFTDFTFLGGESYELEMPIINEYTNEVLKEISGKFIIQIDGDYVQSIDIFAQKIEDNRGELVQIKIFDPRKGKFENKEIEIDSEGYFSNYDPLLSGKVILSNILEGDYPANNNDFKSGDIVISMNGNELESGKKFMELLEKNAGNEIDMVIFRWGVGEIEKNITLNKKSDNNEPIFGAEFYENISSGFDSYYVKYKGFMSGFNHSINMIHYQFKVLGSFITKAFQEKDPSIVIKSVGGPVLVGSTVNQLVSSDNILDIINLAALISLTLGIMNLLPVLPLDGGFLVVLIIEKLIGKPLPEKYQKYAVLFGLLFFLLLTVLVTLKDVLQVVGLY